MNIYFIPIFFVVVSFITQVINKKKYDYLLVLAISIFVIIFSGLRYYAGADYEGYVDIYKETPRLSSFDSASTESIYGEIGYLFFSSIFKTLGLEFVFVALFISAISIGLKSYFFLKYCRYAALALSMYLCLNFITVEFIEIRWSAATSFILVGFYFLYRKKFLTAYFYFILASFFHYFSLVFILFSIFYFFKGSRIYFLGFVLSLAVAVLLKNDFYSIGLLPESSLYVMQRLGRYISNPESNVGLFSYLKIILYVSILIFYTYTRKHSFYADDAAIFLLKFSLVFLSFALVVSVTPIIFFRTMAIADIFTIALIVRLIGKDSRVVYRNLFFLPMVGVFSLWCFIDVNNNFDAGRLFEYKSWLSLLF